MFAIRATFARWLERRRVAAELAELNDRMLADIGLTRDGIESFAAVAADLAYPSPAAPAPSAPSAPVFSRPAARRPLVVESFPA